MEVTFLGIAAIAFFIVGALLLLSPGIVEKLAKVTNRVLFSLDDKIPRVRRPVGIFLLAVSIFLWYIALWELWKWK